jgi:anti-anti-sigma factor
MNEQLVHIEQERRDGCLILRLSGEIDLSNTELVEWRVGLALEGWSRVVIDLAGIDYIDSQGLRLLNQLSNRLARENTKLELVAPRNGVARDLLEMTRLGDEIEIRDAIDD